MRCDLAAALERKIRETPHEELAALVGELERARAVALVRLLAPANPPAVRETADENLSVAAAALRLGVSRDWLYRNAKKLPFTVRIGRKLLFDARGLERWNRQRTGRTS